jgi:ribose transport system permease protein
LTESERRGFTPAAVPAAILSPDSRTTRLRRGSLEGLRDYGILIGVAVLFIVLATTSSVFLTKGNLLNIVDQTAPVGIIACAGTLVVIAGGIDLSTAAIYAITGVLAVKAANLTSVPVGFLAGIAAGAGLGIFNGLIIAYGRITSLIATLATALVIGGCAQVVTGGDLTSAKNLSFETFGNASVGGLTDTSIIFLVVAALLWVLLARTVVGRWIYATGGNAAAGRLSGLPINRIRLATFVASGLAAGIAGVLEASRIGQGQADAGSGLQLTALTAIFVGGTSLAGGRGAIWRTLAGAFLLTLIGNGFDLLGLNPTYQQIVQGAIIIAAVAADVWARRRGADEV